MPTPDLFLSVLLLFYISSYIHFLVYFTYEFHCCHILCCVRVIFCMKQVKTDTEDLKTSSQSRMLLHTPLARFELSLLLFMPSVRKTLLVNLYASVCDCGISFLQQQEQCSYIILHRRIQYRPWNSALMPGQETGKWEWILYVPADRQPGAKATEEMY